MRLQNLTETVVMRQILTPRWRVSDMREEMVEDRAGEI